MIDNYLTSIYGIRNGFLVEYMIEKKYANEDLEIELTSYIDDKQNFWFRKKGIAKILGYSVTDQAIRKHVSDNHKQLICCPVEIKVNKMT